MKYISTVIMLLFTFGAGVAQLPGTAYKQNVLELKEIPWDSTNAEQMKIWVPVERLQSMVTVTITTNGRIPVRHLLHSLLKKNYYNFYWNKKDDSGKYVKEGTYLVDIKIGQIHKQDPITVTYKPGENSCYVSTTGEERQITVKVVEDSIKATLQFYDIRKRLAEIVFADSLLTRGKYIFVWNPSDTIYPGRFTGSLKVGEYEHLFPIRYRK